MQRCCWTQVVWQVVGADICEATLSEQELEPFGIPDRDMAFDLREQPPFTEALHEVVPVRRVQIQRGSRLQRVMNGPADAQELIVIHVLTEIQSESRVEVARVRRAKFHDVRTMERAVSSSACVSTSFGLPHESLGEIDADIFVNSRTDEVEQYSVAAAEVGNDFVAGQLDERQQSPESPNGVNVVLIDIALIVNGMQLFPRESVNRSLRCHNVATIIDRPMTQPAGTASTHASARQSAADLTWGIVLGAARAVERLARAGQRAAFAIGNDNELHAVAAEDPATLVVWQPDVGWEALLPADDPRQALLDLYLPICAATTTHPTTIGHLGQSLDGFIATHAGESQWVTGGENLLHLHRLRALCDAVVVGAGTVAADDPQLTTRLVSGPNPLRVILDPMARLSESYRVFQDDAAETLYVCGRSFPRRNQRHFGRATVAVVSDSSEGIDIGEVVRLLRARGCARIFVEGGGVTVSTFFEADLLDRLHLAVAPLLIGDGRPAIRLQPRAALGDCRRPRYRVFRMGADMLFDFDLRASGDGRDVPIDSLPAITRVI